MKNRIVQMFSVALVVVAATLSVQAAPQRSKVVAENPSAETREGPKSERPGYEQGETRDGSSTSRVVDVNTASLVTLRTLPNVGPQTAASIASHRPYRSAAQFRSRNARYISPLEWSQMARRVRF